MEKMNTTLISGVLSDALSKHSEENRDLLNDFLSKSIEVNNNKFEEINTKMEALMKTKTKMIYRPDFDVAGEKSYFGEFIKKGDANLNYFTKSISGASDASGGYLLPRNIDDQIHQAMSALSPIRSLARVMKVSSESYEFIQEKEGLEVGWGAEDKLSEETKTPEFKKLRIQTFQIYARPRVSQKIIDDSEMNIEAWLSERIAQQMAMIENQAFLNGDGQNKPKGILTYGCYVGAAQENKFESFVSGSNGDIDDADVLINTMHALKPQYLNGAAWMMSRSALAAIRKLKETTTNSYLWQPGSGEQTQTLLGYPVHVCDDMPALKSGEESTPIIFGNFQEAYQVVDRQGVEILRDPYSAKPFIEFYVTKRVGGDVTSFDALKMITAKEA